MIKELIAMTCCDNPTEREAFLSDNQKIFQQTLKTGVRDFIFSQCGTHAHSLEIQVTTCSKKTGSKDV